MNARGSRVVVELIVTAAAHIFQRTLSHHDWPASLSRPAMPRSPIHVHSAPTTYTVYAIIFAYSYFRGFGQVR